VVVLKHLRISTEHERILFMFFHLTNPVCIHPFYCNVFFNVLWTVLFISWQWSLGVSHRWKVVETDIWMDGLFISLSEINSCNWLVTSKKMGHSCPVSEVEIFYVAEPTVSHTSMILLNVPLQGVLTFLS
jgi:hypothetical protein